MRRCVKRGVPDKVPAFRYNVINGGGNYVAALAPHLNDDETTVGTRISLTHTAPSLVGMTLTACAEITAHTGRQYEFTVTVRDEIGVVAEGTHTRVLVNTSRFLANADARTRK